jgi:hypothetical protein
MNKIQTGGGYKTQRKRRTRVVALAQVAASKISHSKSSEYSQNRSLPHEQSAQFLGGQKGL